MSRPRAVGAAGCHDGGAWQPWWRELTPGPGCPGCPAAAAAAGGEAGSSPPAGLRLPQPPAAAAGVPPQRAGRTPAPQGWLAAPRMTGWSTGAGAAPVQRQPPVTQTASWGSAGGRAAAATRSAAPRALGQPQGRAQCAGTRAAACPLWTAAGPGQGQGRGRRRRLAHCPRSRNPLPPALCPRWGCRPAGRPAEQVGAGGRRVPAGSTHTQEPADKQLLPHWLHTRIGTHVPPSPACVDSASTSTSPRLKIARLCAGPTCWNSTVPLTCSRAVVQEGTAAGGARGENRYASSLALKVRDCGRGRAYRAACSVSRRYGGGATGQ